MQDLIPLWDLSLRDESYMMLYDLVLWFIFVSDALALRLMLHLLALRLTPLPMLYVFPLRVTPFPYA